MSDNKFIISSFSHFFNYHPLRLILLFLITLFLGLTQGVTIIMLIPLLGLLNPDQATGETSRLNDFFNKIIENTGIELNLTLILSFFAVSLHHFPIIFPNDYAIDLSAGVFIPHKTTSV